MRLNRISPDRVGELKNNPRKLRAIIDLYDYSMSHLSTPWVKIFFFLGVCLLFGNTAQTQIVNIESQRRIFDTDTTEWFGSVDLGFNFTENGSRIFTITGNAHLEYLHRKSLWISLTNYQVVNANGESFVNDGFQHLRYNRPISKRITAEVFGQVQYNEKLKIRVRGLAGIGPRFQVLSLDKGLFFIGTQYMYQYEEIANTSIIHRDHRLSCYLSVNYQFSPALKVVNTSYYQPLITDFTIMRISSQTSFLLRISSHLAFRSTFSISLDNRLSEDAQDVPFATYSFRNGLKWTF